MNFTFESRSIGLRPIEEPDYPILLHWRNEERFLRLFSSRRNIVSLTEFVAETKRVLENGPRHIQFVIVRKKDNKVIGTTYSFNLDLTDGYVFINTYMDEEVERRGYGMIATLLLIRYLFDSFPIHKIYFEVFAYNELSHSTMKSAEFIEEGRFKDHRFYGGKRHDVIRLAFYRDAFEKKARPFIERLCRDPVLTKESKRIKLKESDRD